MSTTLASESSTALSHSNSQIPSASAFSFKAPLSTASSSLALHTSVSTPASPLKQRRVSLALPNSPRLVPAWSFRDDTGIESHVAETSGLVPEKKVKIRKIANGADEEGEQHITLPEKKPRKKWTPEETQMLVDGCNRHGVGNWKAILSDPTLQFDNRSPVDLKDRFRTYFPDAYKQHYPNARTHLSSKIRSTLPDGSSLFEKTRSKKRRPFTEEEDRALKAGYEKHGTVWAQIVKDPIFQEQNRRSTDLRDRFRNAFPELYQAAGYKPRNASRKKLADGARVPIRAATDDQLTMSTTGPVRSRKRAHTSSGLFRGGTKSVPQSTACSEDEDSSGAEEDNDSAFKLPPTPVFVDSTASSTRGKKQLPPPPAVTTLNDTAILDDDDMELVTLDSDPLAAELLRTNSQGSEMDARSQAWSSGLDTPTHSSQAAWSTAAGSPTSSHLSADFTMNSAHSSPFQRRLENPNMGNMIGKSAWTQDWFSPNPRLDPGSSGATSSYIDGGLSPASPFSFHALNYGVMDRYDLFPASNPHDFMSEVGVGDSHSTFSDDVFPSSAFRGFTHHSNYAGDLIFGARTHQPQQSFYPSGLGFGTDGLGLTGMAQQNLHPLGIHTPVLPGIDEIGLTGISLDDQPDDMMEDTVSMGLSQQKDEPQDPPSISDRFNLDDLVNIPQESHITPPGTPQTRPRASSRAPTGSGFQSNFSQHGRSISVPPSEARSGYPSRVPMQTPQSDLMSKSLVFFGQGVDDSPMDENNAGAAGGSVEPGRMQESLSSSSSTGTGSSIYSPNLLLSSSAGQHSQTSQGQTPVQDGWRFSSANPSELVDVLDLHYYNHFTNGNANAAVAMPTAGLDLAQPLVVNPKSLSSGGMTGTGTIRRYSQHHSSRPSVTLTIGGAKAGPPSSSSSVSSSVGGTASVPASATSNKTIPTSVSAAVAAGIVTSNIGPKSVPPPPPPPPSMRHQTGSGSSTVAAAGGGHQHHHHHQRGQSAVCPQDLILRTNDNKRKRASWDGRHP
ncbi:hypothetical protein BDN72DRAFT_903520 [Pluteus cervinus]|uniref:Uncharacterized protein n=1 Tax=Pluteus cervinus TaxID=181527 RepID=A0ACD3A8B4_9AGAR|nr:hypothetical protein BDN72DRAFT_903520 [Pluteus cervinus]